MTNPVQNIPLTRYLVHYGGSLGVRRIEFDRKERNATAMVEYVKRDLPNYWPAYYAADIFHPNGNHLTRITTKIVAEAKP